MVSLEMANAQESCLLKAVFHPQPGIDVEHGQGAIERNELAHRPLDDRRWLIRVDDPDPLLWQKKLNAALQPGHGFFEVGPPSPEEQQRFDAGEIEFQQ